MKKSLTLFLLLFSLQTIAQLTTPGDIVIISLSTDPYQGKQHMTFVTLKDIPASTQITFTDIYWKNEYNIGFNHPWSANDGHFTWTSSETTVIKAGTVIRIEATINSTTGLVTTVSANNGNCNVGDAFYWTNADQIIAYKGAPTIFPPAVFLWGYSTTNWIYNSNNNATTSDLPAALHTSNCNIAFGGVTGSSNTSFTDDPIYQNMLNGFIGSRHAFIKRFTNPSAYIKSSNSLGTYPDFNFKFTQSGLTPITSAKVSLWDFSNGTLHNTDGKSPIQGRNAYVMATPLLQMRAFNFPLAYTEDSLAGIVLHISTTGKTGITLSFDVSLSTQVANSLSIEYSNNSLNWIPVIVDFNKIDISSVESRPIASVSYQDYTSTLRFTTTDVQSSGAIRVQIPLPSAVDNKESIYFRIRIAADPTTINDRLNYVGYGPYQRYYSWASNIFFDNIYIGYTDIIPTVRSNTSLKVKETNQNPLSVYPNPASNYITITHEQAQEGDVISIIDAQSGHLVMTKSMVKNSKQTTILVNALSKGKHYVARFNNRAKGNSVHFFVN